MFSYKIINNDRMKLLKAKKYSVQLVITSPPYNIGKSYEKEAIKFVFIRARKNLKGVL